MKLDDKYLLESGTVLLSGLQALARLPLDLQRAQRRRGLRTGVFISGYPGSPLAGFDKELGRNAAVLSAHDVIHQPGVNEELAATAVMGSQAASTIQSRTFDGVAAMWYGKSPGVDRAGDVFKHGNYAGTDPEGGVLVVAGDDPSCKSSSIPSGSEVAFYDALMPVLFPSDPHDVLNLGLHGYALSRAANLWVGFKAVTAVVDGFADVQVHAARVVPRLPEAAAADAGRAVSMQLLPPHTLAAERDIYESRLPRALEYARVNALNRIAVHPRDAWFGIVAAGSGYAAVLHALDRLGLDFGTLERAGVRLLKMGMIWPLEPAIVTTFADGLEQVLVVEDKRPFLESHIKSLLYGHSNAPVIMGKTDERGAPLLPQHSAIEAETIADVLARRLGARVGALDGLEDRLRRPAPQPQPTALPMVPVREPFYCSGCPHNRSTQAPEGTLVGAGIGCHAMALWMNPERFGTVTGMTQMGGEGAQWIGMAPFVAEPHLVQNVGDGTFFHSAHLALRAAIASGVDITYKILYNDAVAMTGGQPVPGALGVPELTHLLHTEGVRKIIVTTEDPRRYRRAALAEGTEVWHRDRLSEAQEALANLGGVTVLIHDQHCTAELRRLRKRGQAPEPQTRLVINERVCEGCGDCGEVSNCLSLVPVDTEFGDKTAIHQSSCNKDYSCLLGDCPSFVGVTPARRRRRRRAQKELWKELPDPSPLLEAPQTQIHTGDVRLRMAGVGGTGVVTVSQVLATAAVLAGKHVAGQDQTGLSQKGGAVVSDLRIAVEPISANRVLRGDADVLLAFDALAALAPATIAAAAADRTVAVVSTTRMPTGKMVSDRSVTYPADAGIQAAIDGVTRSSENVYLDAGEWADRLFRDHLVANVLLLGSAYQAGLVPVDAEFIEQAITLNGASVEKNIAAFRWGRALVANPARAHALLGATKQPASPSTAAAERFDLSGLHPRVEKTVAARAADLADYQNVAYARRYVEAVRGVAEREGQIPSEETALTEAVARYLHKLMAYKDEYEVARLQLDAAFRAQLQRDLGDVGRVSWYLHPPLLRYLGLRRKLRLGPWFGVVFRALRGLRRLRGTPFDLFGYAKVRRTERALVAEYEEMVEQILDSLTPATHAEAVQVASLPDMVRGYENIKLRSVERYRHAVREGLPRLTAASATSRTGADE